MRFRLQLSTSTHSEAITGVGWLGPDEAVSVSDDHSIWRWSMAKLEGAELPNQIKESIFPTSLHLVPRHLDSAQTGGGQSSAIRSSNQKQRSAMHNSSGGGSVNDTMLMTASDGKVHLVNVSGKIERSVDAHQGAAIAARWNNAEPNGAGGFASCGEDGAVKMWSRNGMLRSVLAQLAKPVYAVDWNGDGTKLVYCADEDCFIKLLKTQNAPIKWRAHSGLVLCLSWSAVNDQIVSGGEDCRYRLWDAQGHPLWSSGSHGHPICALAWSPNGKMFGVGAFNLIRLCDKSGWSHSVERPNCGSVYCLAWSADGTQLVGGCASGQMLHAHVIERRLLWEQLEAVQTRKKTINIRDLSSEVARERLETRDRVIRLELGFGFLVVATTKQCYIFSAKNWNTPVVVDLREGAGLVSLLRLCEKCFLLVDAQSVQVWNYEGRVLSTIRLPSSAGSAAGTEPFSEQTAAIANDLVVLRDRAQHTLVHMFDPQTGKTAGDGPITHNANIVELCVNQHGSLTENRRVAFVDANGDCFLALVHCFGSRQRTAKIGALISCLWPNNATNMIAAIQDNQRLIVWTDPNTAFMDRDLLVQTQLELDNSAELGRSSTIVSFIGNSITVRRSDGCLLAHYVPPFVAAIIRCAHQSQWDQAVRICRAIKEDYLWATLASLTVIDRNYTVAEICYGQLREMEKVQFCVDIRSDAQLRSAMIAQFSGHRREADAQLVHAGRHFRAIMLNLGMFQFDRALELALKTDTHVDTVLGYRQRYLELIGKKESDPKYLKHLAQVEVDWPHIMEKIKADEDKERHQ